LIRAKIFQETKNIILQQKYRCEEGRGNGAAGCCEWRATSG